MRIGVLIRLTRNIDVKQKFLEIRRAGFTSCQLVCWDRKILQDEKIVEKINDAVKEYEIHITAFWCGWEGRRIWDFYEGQLTLGLIPAAYRWERTKMLLEGVEFARKIHVDHFATHVGYMPENPYDPRYYEVLSACKSIVEKCRENGIHFLFETGQETPVTLKRAIQDIEADLGKGSIGINLDPANLLMYGKANPVDALDIFGEYVKGVHGKDGLYPTDGHRLGKEMPLGQGRVNYPVFIAKLKEIGYDGDITIEREISGKKQEEDIMMAKRLLEQLI